MLLISYQVKSQNLTHNKNSEKMEKLAKQEIESLLMTYKGTLNTSDAEKAASLYTKDGIFMPSSAPSAIGTENVKAAYDFVFSQIQLSIEFYIEEITVEGTFAYAVTSSKGSVLIHATGDKVPEENRELFVFEKENGTWKIARYMFNKIK
jgi:uncharacterized protein (TIGR02246 family)